MVGIGGTKRGKTSNSKKFTSGALTMTKQQRNMIVVQILLSIVVIIWMLFAFCLVDLIGIRDVFNDFRRNDYHGIIAGGEFWGLFLYYCVMCGLIGFFGIYSRNIIANILGILWAFSFLGIRLESFAQFQPYFFTTWEGRLFLVDIAARVSVLLIALIGIAVICRSRYYKRKAKQQR